MCLGLYLDTTIVKDKLEQIGTWKLFGNVMCMKSVRLSGSDRDSLLLSFQDAKVCCVVMVVSIAFHLLEVDTAYAVCYLCLLK